MNTIGALRKSFIPTWAKLRGIGNSRAVQASAIFPVVGYVILLSNGVTNFFDGGIAGAPSSKQGVWHQLWSAKLYFIYFGLLFVGLGSTIYQWRCPRQIKKHGDWEDYVRTDGLVMHHEQLSEIRFILVEYYRLANVAGSYTLDQLRTIILNRHYAALSTDEWFVRLAVAVLFYGGIFLLAIPSLMTAIKISTLIV